VARASLRLHICRGVARAGMATAVLVHVRPVIRLPPVGLTHLVYLPHRLMLGLVEENKISARASSNWRLNVSGHLGSRHRLLAAALPKLT